MLPLTGCGAMQSYQQGLDANQAAWARQQHILDEQNTIEVNKLQAIQREQDIQKSRAEGQMDQAKAAGEAQATIIAAQAQAEANQIIARSLSPLLVEQNLIGSLNDKSVIYLPSGSLPLINVGAK
jgi:regulator of protease activity HflC (stomatin/prohibitin superfamily)